jgi:hypothetical protein
MAQEGLNARDKRAKFLELANKRVSRTLKDIGLVANLANRRNYDYTEEEARKIVKTLQARVDQVKRDFESGLQTSKNKFEL